MATHDSHAATTTADTTTRHRQLTTRAREACETILEPLLRPTSIQLRDLPKPDGSFIRTENGACRKTWRRQHSGERIQLSTRGPAATWQLEHQTTDGTARVVERGLEREAAYRAAERFMADLDDVHAQNRTGRATE